MVFIFFKMEEIDRICKKGDLNEIKKIINDENINNIFGYSCEYGHLDVAKYLINKNKDIDIHANYEWAFRWSCTYGHLEVAKWLYSFGNVDIHADNECAFRWSCIHGRSDVVKWLCKISDRYDYYIKYDGKIGRIFNKYKFNKNPYVIRCGEFSDIKIK